MIALILILGLLGGAALVGALAGRLVRVPAPACSQACSQDCRQDCRQGRNCSCGAAAGEVQP